MSTDIPFPDKRRLKLIKERNQCDLSHDLDRFRVFMAGWGRFEPGLRRAVQRLFGWPDPDGRRAAKGQTNGTHPINAFDTGELRMLMKKREKAESLERTIKQTLTLTDEMTDQLAHNQAYHAWLSPTHNSSPTRPSSAQSADLYPTDEADLARLDDLVRCELGQALVAHTEAGRALAAIERAVHDTRTAAFKCCRCTPRDEDDVLGLIGLRESGRAGDRLAEVGREVGELERQVGEVGGELRAVRSEVREATTANAILKKEVGKIREEADKIHEELITGRDVDQRSAALRVRVAGQSDRIVRVKGERDALRGMLANLRAEVWGAERDLADATGQAEAVEERLAVAGNGRNGLEGERARRIAEGLAAQLSLHRLLRAHCVSSATSARLETNLAPLTIHHASLELQSQALTTVTATTRRAELLASEAAELSTRASADAPAQVLAPSRVRAGTRVAGLLVRDAVRQAFVVEDGRLRRKYDVLAAAVMEEAGAAEERRERHAAERAARAAGAIERLTAEVDALSRVNTELRIANAQLLAKLAGRG